MVFTIYGRGGNLGHVTWTIYTLWFPIPKRLHIKFGFDWLSDFREEDYADGQTTDRPWLDGYTISSQGEPAQVG